MSISELRKKSNVLFLEWMRDGFNEASDKLNDGNIEIIKEYFNTYPDAMLYSYKDGFFKPESIENVYNFSCDYVCNSASEYYNDAVSAHDVYTKMKSISNLDEAQKAVEKADGICLVWS